MTAIQTQADVSPENTKKSESLVGVVLVGLVVGGAAALMAVFSPARAEHPTATPSTVTTALPPLPREQHNDRVTTSTGEVSAAGVAGIASTLMKDGPIADPGGITPKPRNGALFHRMTEGPMTLRVYTVGGSPETVMTAYGKDLEGAGWERDSDAPAGPTPTDGHPRAVEDKKDKDSAKDEKPNARGRIHRVYMKKDTEALISVSRGEGGQTLVTIVEEPKRGEP